jgi:hypothetical protein
MAHKARYREGDWFAVPLREGGYAAGMVARANSEGVLLGYFFGPAGEEVPSLQCLEQLDHGRAVFVCTFGHLALRSGTWPIVGRSPGWSRRDWPMPSFARHEELTGRSFRVSYDDADPNRLLSEEEIPSVEAEQLPKDGLFGAGAVEKILTKLLG